MLTISSIIQVSEVIDWQVAVSLTHLRQEKFQNTHAKTADFHRSVLINTEGLNGLLKPRQFRVYLISRSSIVSPQKKAWGMPKAMPQRLRSHPIQIF
jgi:hypothetical protein